MMKTAVSLLPFLLIPLLILSLPTTDPALPDLSAYPWALGQEPPDNTTRVDVIFVGDVLLGRGVDPAADPLRAVAPWLAAADLTVGNLEGFIAPYAESAPVVDASPTAIYLPMPVTAVSTLRHAGFDILSLANNHSLDGGAAGLQETVTRLHNAGLQTVGLDGRDPLFYEVDGVRLAFFAFNAIPPFPTAGTEPKPQVWDAETAVPAIRAARAQADAVIVLMHWGFEYETQPDLTQQRIAQQLRDAGADLVVGHHPHVVQPIAVADNGVVAYSLGNFLFDQTQEGMALRAVFTTDGLQAAQVLPLQSGLRPYLLPLAQSESLLARVLPPPPRLAFACTDDDCVAATVPQTESSGLFFSGQIDLTGDGVPETVRREGERVTVYAGETAVWQTPEAWRVVDVALGDANDDGRYEIMLAIWREDGAGYERSQPYIVGYRNGRYDLLWGGRPVGDPIKELALGDVDGDGIEELLVIEELADGSSQAVSVWQWQGWTFALQWRSTPITGSCYRDLLWENGEMTVTQDDHCHS
ncbi:MAG: CapA family protein [Anaerolineales bacterium]|nr:CapA family protein [Anaerolineales bacterium]